jgi:hypothetical protein
MYCPQCGSTQSDELKFCKACGANLGAVRTAMVSRETGEGFNWNKTWIAEMLLSGEESVKRAREIERLQGITPETKRQNEIKAGVITASVGIGLMFVLFVIMEGIVRNGRISEAAVEILSRIWVVGAIPLMVGAALIVNGVFVSKRSKILPGHETDTGTRELKDAANEYLPPAETGRVVPVDFSVTDETTRHLEEPALSEKPASK